MCKASATYVVYTYGHSLSLNGAFLICGSVPETLNVPVWALLWILGGACAVAAAVLAKVHRLVALVLIGGAGLATCISFIWLSAPDLALTQLLVEIVTLVLLLLGLRWLPLRLPDVWPADRKSVV